MDVKDPPDFSSYILFEATGDSEADYDPIMGGYSHEIPRSDEEEEDDDDALSCSDDRSDACNAAEFNCYESCDADNEQDEEQDGVYGTSHCEDDEMQEEHHKSFVSFDSCQEPVDEMEKNRLFWEACLAS